MYHFCRKHCCHGLLINLKKEYIIKSFKVLFLYVTFYLIQIIQLLYIIITYSFIEFYIIQFNFNYYH